MKTCQMKTEWTRAGDQQGLWELGQSRWGTGGRYAPSLIFRSPEHPSLLIEPVVVLSGQGHLSSEGMSPEGW